MLCTNTPSGHSAFYDGTEPSPKGLGLCARYILLGTKKRGKDGNWWIVSSVKNGVRRWKKIPKAKAKPKAKATKPKSAIRKTKK